MCNRSLRRSCMIRVTLLLLLPNQLRSLLLMFALGSESYMGCMLHCTSLEYFTLRHSQPSKPCSDTDLLHRTVFAWTISLENQNRFQPHGSSQHDTVQHPAVHKRELEGCKPSYSLPSNFMLAKSVQISVIIFPGRGVRCDFWSHLWSSFYTLTTERKLGFSCGENPRKHRIFGADLEISHENME